MEIYNHDLKVIRKKKKKKHGFMVSTPWWPIGECATAGRTWDDIVTVRWRGLNIKLIPFTSTGKIWLPMVRPMGRWWMLSETTRRALWRMRYEMWRFRHGMGIPNMHIMCWSGAVCIYLWVCLNWSSFSGLSQKKNNLMIMCIPYHSTCACNPNKNSIS